MPTPTVLEFTFNDQPIRFPVADIETVTSPFTGRELRKLQTEVTIAPQDADLAKAFLAAGIATDAAGSRWSGNLDMESYTDHGPHSLQITWSESEQVMADAVQFGDLVLTPTRYEERLNDDGSIVIAFQAVLTPQETDLLRSLWLTKRAEVQYRPTIRRGVSDEPRNMRLGRVLWQSLDDGGIGHDITLVDEAFDTSDTQNAFLGLAGEPQVGNLVQQVSALLAQFETLLAELETVGALTPEAIQRVRASADTLAAVRRHIFFEVSDLSKW